jgi:acyl carrier protein
MDLEHMQERLKKILIEKTGVKKEVIEPTDRLVDDLALDSLDAVELAMGIEEEFGLTILDADIKKLQTVADVLNLISHRLSESDADATSG